MKRTPDFLTNDVARRIFYQLEENDTGYLPYGDYQVKYTSEGGRNKKVKLDLIDEDGKHLNTYHLNFGNSFSDYSVE